MILTRDLIDLIESEHGRTSCSDTNLSNSDYDIEHGYFPRCRRCYLLSNENLDTDLLDFEVHIETFLTIKEKSYGKNKSNY